MFGLQAAVEAAVGVPAASQRLVAMDERRAVVMTLEADDAEIRRTFGFRSGEDVVLEVRPHARCPTMADCYLTRLAPFVDTGAEGG